MMPSADGEDHGYSSIDGISGGSAGRRGGLWGDERCSSARVFSEIERGRLRC